MRGDAEPGAGLFSSAPSVSTLCEDWLKDGPLMRIFADRLTAGFSAQHCLFFDGRTVIQNFW